jgi:hypothetical protein
MDTPLAVRNKTATHGVESDEKFETASSVE